MPPLPSQFGARSWYTHWRGGTAAYSVMTTRRRCARAAHRVAARPARRCTWSAQRPAPRAQPAEGGGSATHSPRIASLRAQPGVSSS